METVKVAWTALAVFLMSSVVVQPAAHAKEVVVYTSEDQVFSEPVLKDFEKKTGITVKPLYDVESSKTTGMVNRLIAEKDHPKCDVFWNSEFAQTLVLKDKGVLAPYASPSAADIPKHFKDAEDYWTGYSVRARVLIYNTNLLKKEDLPKSLFDLTDPRWKGKFAMAYPLFGTTRTHMAALYVAVGPEKTQEFLKGLKANDALIVDGNSVVRDMVVDGEVPIGLTDTDDANAPIIEGKSVAVLFPDKGGLGTLMVPNTVAMIKNCPHPEEAKAMIDYLLSREVESKLAFSEAAQIPVREGVKKPEQVPDVGSFTVMEADYRKVAENMDEAATFTQSLFAR
ncbi:MAG: extracellular solute-binding protein [Syntrophobacteraceae bacterium]